MRVSMYRTGVVGWWWITTVSYGCRIGEVSGVVVFFFFYVYGDHRDLHRVDRRQRQMCIRDSAGTGQKRSVGRRGAGLRHAGGL